MTRALAISVVVVSLVTGCVSVSPAQTSQPSLGPSFGITTQAPSPSATQAPTTSPAPTGTPTQAPTPTVAATVAASGSPAPALTPTPSPEVIEDFGAGTLLFADDFSDSTSGWGVGPNSGGVVAYGNGALQFTTAADGNWMWSRRTDPLAWPVMHVEASVTPSANGYAGLLCARSDDELWGAVANATGRWVFVRIDSTGANILSSNHEAGWAIAPEATTRMALDCAGTATGAFRMQLSLPDVGLAASYVAAAGPESFDRAGLYAESDAHPYSLRVDDAFVYGGEGDTGTSVAAQALILHVPADWRADCFETPPNPFETGALAVVSCALTGGRSEVADYVQFDTQENMDAAYQTRVDAWAIDSTDSCQTGPNEVSYTIGRAPAGHILCAPRTVGIRVDWTYDTLLILSTLTDFDASYPDAFADWLIAGPE